VADIDSMWVSLRVAQRDILPPICCDCGQTTHRVTKVRASTSERDDTPTWLKLILCAVTNWILGLYFLLLHGIADANVVEVKMPQCDLCAANGRPRPEYVDFGNARMTFVVHRNLRDSATN
jgi:hypothetical protein